LAGVTASINTYFDPSSRKTQVAVDLLKQLQGQMKTLELPRVDDTLAALTTAAAGR
jgi:uroporphyrin-3 C-methyltransferase